MSDTVDTDIEANAILNSYMYRVLQKTLPRRSWEEWGLSTQDALDAGFNAAPTRTWLWNRTNSGSCAVNADAVVMVAGLTRLALEGKIAKKFNPQNTAEKVLIFFHDELGCDIPAIDHRIFEPNNRHDTAACLSACVESLFSSLVDKSRKSKRALRKAVENRREDSKASASYATALESTRKHSPSPSILRTTSRKRRLYKTSLSHHVH